MKHIIIATDFSGNAWNALNYACDLLKDEQCIFHLINIYEVPRTTADMLLSLREIMKRDSEEGLKALLKKTNKELFNPLHQFTTYSGSGDLEEELTGIAEKYGAALAVVAVNSTGTMETLLGTQATRIVEKITCPALIIPQKVQFRKPEKLLFATDYRKIRNNAVLDPFLWLAEKFNAEIMVLHVVEAEEVLTTAEGAEEIKLDRIFEKSEHAFYTITEESPLEGIEKFLKDHRADMLAMITHRYGFWKRLFHRSEVAKAALYTEIPLLALPE